MKKRNNFTLVELLVAMGIFCLLLMISMQIFGGAQKLWVNSEQKSTVFASARTAMEFVAARIQTCVYVDNIPFGIYEKFDSKYYKKIYFPTTMTMNRKVVKDDVRIELDKYDLRFLGFQLNDNGELEMRVFSDRSNGSTPNANFKTFLPPYSRRNRVTNLWNIHKNVKSGVFDDSQSDKIVVAEYVTDFRLIPFYNSTTGKNDKIKADFSVSEHKNPPFLLEIEISMLDSKEHFKDWKDAGGKEQRDEIMQEYGYTFRRAVLLGFRKYREGRDK